MDFAPSGKTYRLDYLGDGTSASLEIDPCGAVQIFSTENVVVNFGTTEALSEAVYPTNDGDSGAGCIVQGDWLTTLPLPGFQRIPQGGSFWISASSDTAGYLLVSTGALI